MMKITAEPAISRGLDSLQEALNARKEAWLPGADRKCAEKMKELLSAVEETSTKEPLNQELMKNICACLTNDFEDFSKGPKWFSTIRSISSRVYNYVLSKGGQFKSSWEIGEMVRATLLSKCKPLDFVQSQAQYEILISKKDEIEKNILDYKKSSPSQFQEVIQNLEKTLKEPTHLLNNESVALLQEIGVFPNGLSAELKNKQEVALIQHCLKNKLFNELKTLSEAFSPEHKLFTEKYLPFFKEIEESLVIKYPAQELRKAFNRFIERSISSDGEKGGGDLNKCLKSLFTNGLDFFLIQSILERKVDRSVLMEYKTILDSKSFFGPSKVPLINALLVRSEHFHEWDNPVCGFYLSQQIDGAAASAGKLKGLKRIDDKDLQDSNLSVNLQPLSINLHKSSKKYSSLLLGKAEKSTKKAHDCFFTSSRKHHMDIAKKAIDKFLQQHPDSHDGIRLERQAKLYSDFLQLNTEMSPSHSDEKFSFLSENQDFIKSCLKGIMDRLNREPIEKKKNL